MEVGGSLQSVEPHVENPHESALFNEYPTFAKNHHAVSFLPGS